MVADPPPVDSPGPENTCLLCARKFSSAEALAKHERFSELHRRNLELQDEVVLQYKREVESSIIQLRSQLTELTVMGRLKARVTKEKELRKQLGEFSQAQEALEHSRTARYMDPARRLSPGHPLAQQSVRQSGDQAAASLLRPTWRQGARVGCYELEAAAATWQGCKEVQEDRYILDIELHSPEGLPIPGFCVLDGHSGSLCVDHLLERLPTLLQLRLATKPCLNEEYLCAAVNEAFAIVDEEFLIAARQREAMDGSTLILCLFFQEGTPRPPRPQGSCRLLIANVGDSRAVLCRAAPGPNGAEQLTALRLSDDHKPNRPDEQQRIQALGGLVDHHGVWRVFVPTAMNFGGRSLGRWGLAVSRSFGDLLLKEPERYGCPGVLPGGLVIAQPELKVLELEPSTDRFVVMACDGIWDVLRDEDAVAVCAAQVGVELAAHSLIRHAFAAGSGDNLTALVISWRWTE